MLEVISRKEAKARGLKRYFTGHPCKHGHLAYRWVAKGVCSTCLVEAIAAYRQTAEGRARNKEAAARYRVTARGRTKNNARSRRYRATAEGHARHAARLRQREIAQLRRTPAWADLSRISTIYEHAAQMRRETGVQMHVDHVIPLRGKHVSGLHVHENLRIVPAVDNIRKGNRFEDAA